MFEGWENFYLLIGGASGSLIGLFFIVVTLMSGRERQSRLEGVAVFMTPTVGNLAAVLVFSAGAMAPHIGADAMGLLMGAGGLAGAIYMIVITRHYYRLNSPEATHWSDPWCYCWIPMALSAGLMLAASMVWLDKAIAPAAIAAVIALMLVMAIRNAWDLVTWLTPGESDAT